jgi:hypothetical protein
MDERWELYLDGYERGMRKPTPEEIEEACQMVKYAYANMITDDDIEETLNLTPEQEEAANRIGRRLRWKIEGLIDGFKTRWDSED